MFHIELPNLSTKRVAVKLKSATEKIIKSGHPWVFSDSIIKQNAEATSGDMAIIFDTKKNTFLAIGLFDLDSPIRIKILQANKPETIDKEWFKRKISAAYNRRKELFKTDTNAYRLIFGENDSFPGFIADVYDKVLVVKLYSTIWFPYLRMILPELIAISQCTTVVMRLSRQLQRIDNNFGITDGMVIYGELEEEVVIFKEHGILFSANVIHGHKTGYFLDHRHNRKKVGALATNKNLLDVFSYAGGFSVHALANGASEVISLDISEQALEMAKKNAVLNTYKGIHKTIVADAFEGMQKMIDSSRKFDIVVIDPPSFAKRKNEIERAMNSYSKLVKLGVQLVNKNGIFVMASCSSRIESIPFFELVEKSILNAGKNFQIFEKTYHDIDHPITFKEASYLKCGYYRIQ